MKRLYNSKSDIITDKHDALSRLIALIKADDDLYIDNITTEGFFLNTDYNYISAYFDGYPITHYREARNEWTEFENLEQLLNFFVDILDNYIRCVYE